MFQRVAFVVKSEKVTTDVITQKSIAVLSSYEDECLTSPPGKEGLVRQDAFIDLINKMHDQQPVDAIVALYDFYKNDKPSSRLINKIEHALIDLAGVRVMETRRNTSINRFAMKALTEQENLSKKIESLRAENRAELTRSIVRKSSTAVTTEMIVQECQKVAKSYDLLCKNTAPGKSGVKRLSRFVVLREELKSDTADVAMIKLYDFYKAGQPGSRLIQAIEKGLFALSGIQQPQMGISLFRNVNDISSALSSLRSFVDALREQRQVNNQSVLRTKKHV